MPEAQIALRLYGLAFGIVAFTFRRRFAHRAVQQVEKITGRRFNEEYYAFGFKYAGLAIATMALLDLLGLLPSAR